MANMFSQNVKYNLLKYSLLQFCLHPHPVHSSGESWEPSLKIVMGKAMSFLGWQWDINDLYNSRIVGKKSN